MGVTEHLPASCPLFPQGGGLRPCLGPIPLASVLARLLRAIPLALSAFLGGREGRDAARLGRGAAGGSWSNRPALEKWLLLYGGFAERKIFSSPFPACCREGGALGVLLWVRVRSLSQWLAGHHPWAAPQKALYCTGPSPSFEWVWARWVIGPSPPFCLQVC